jgi:hypothetical protein
LFDSLCLTHKIGFFGRLWQHRIAWTLPHNHLFKLKCVWSLENSSRKHIGQWNRGLGMSQTKLGLAGQMRSGFPNRIWIS